MNKKAKDATLRIILCAMFAALTAVMTAFVRITTPTGGYVHLGDAIIYLGACFLPTPYAMAFSAVGGGLSDLLVYPETFIYTIVIKALTAVFFTCKKEKILTRRNMLMTIPAGLVTVIGYSISKLIRMLLSGADMYTSVVTALWKMPENSIQAISSALVFIAVAAALDKGDIKKRMLRST